MDFDVFIEIPRGSRNKYEADPHTKRIRLNRILFTSTAYPGDYGFVEETIGDDGDALGVLLVTRGNPLYPGVLVKCRAVGLFQMTDEKGEDQKVLAVPADDPRLEHLRDIHHVPEFDRLEIKHFFEVYKALEPDKTVTNTRWADRAAAELLLERSRRRFLERST